MTAARRKVAKRPAGGLFVCMAFVEQLGGMVCRSLGPAFMVFGMLLVATICYIALWQEPLVPLDEPLWKRASLNGIGIGFVFNIYFNWIMCARTNPGKPPAPPKGPVPRDDPDALEAQGEIEDVLINTSSDTHVTQRRVIPSVETPGLQPGGLKRGWKRCKKCVALKPPRAHHCSICDSCVLAMDHHCPWVASCVGHYNYRYFYLFLLYLVTACAYVAVLGAAYYDVLGVFLSAVPLEPSTQPPPLRPMSRLEQAALDAVPPARHMSSGLSFAFLMCAVVVPAVGMLLVFHTYLILTAQTTIEFYGRQAGNARSQYAGKLSINEYDLGSTRNWELVFGKSSFPLAWARPSTRRPPGDGLSWPTAKSLVMMHHEQIV